MLEMTAMTLQTQVRFTLFAIKLETSDAYRPECGGAEILKSVRFKSGEQPLSYSNLYMFSSPLPPLLMDLTWLPAISSV